MKLTTRVAALATFAVASASLPPLAAQQVMIGDRAAAAKSAPAGGFSFAQVDYSADPAAPGEGKSAASKDEKSSRLFHYSVRLGGRFIYSDNINFAAEPDAIEDFYVSLEPGISVGIGDVPERKRSYINVDYSPNALLYFDATEFNTLNHFIRLEAVAKLDRLTLSLYQDFHFLEGFDVQFENPNRGDRDLNRDAWRYNRDIGGRNSIQYYNTTVMARYEISDKAAVTGAFRYNLTHYEDLFTLDIYSGDLFFDYKLRPELTVGIGGAGGVVNHDDPNIDEQYQEVRGRFTFDLPKRIKIDGNLGLEFRQFGPDAARGYTAPIVETNVAVEPVKGMRLTIGARHRTLVSNALAGQSFTITGANVGLRQRITDRVDFNINSGYEQASYFSVLPDVTATRRDAYYFVEPSIEWRITDKWTAAAFYIHRENQTTLSEFGFAENQVGIRTSVTF